MLIAAFATSACQDEVVTLDATPDAFNANVAAEAIERAGVVNAAKDQPPAPGQQSVTDETLRLRLNDALIFDPLLPPSEISLTVKGGRVKLAGSVGAFFDGARAAEIVSRSPLVLSVDNRLRVRQPGAAVCFLGAR